MNAERPRSTKAGLLLLVLTALLAAGCGSLLSLNKPEVELYNLTAGAPLDLAIPPVTWQLVVEEPLTRGGLDNNRIAIRPSRNRLSYYAGARWTARAPRMVQSLLLETFEDTGKIVAVGRRTIGLRSDYDLQSELREFQAETFEPGRPPAVRVRLNVKLVRQPQQAIIASATFHHTAAADSRRMEDVVAAFDQALGQVLGEVVEWVLTTPEAEDDPAE